VANKAELKSILGVVIDVPSGDTGAAWHALGAIEETCKRALGQPDQAVNDVADQVDRLAVMLADLGADDRRMWIIGLLTRIDKRLDAGRPFERELLELADGLRGRAAFGHWPKKWPGASKQAAPADDDQVDQADNDEV
jgi:hypothetical protein